MKIIFNTEDKNDFEYFASKNNLTMVVTENSENTLNGRFKASFENTGVAICSGIGHGLHFIHKQTGEGRDIEQAIRSYRKLISNKFLLFLPKNRNQRKLKVPTFSLF